MSDFKEKYPQHDKMSQIKTEKRIVANFLEWLDEQGIRLARWQEISPGEPKWGHKLYTIDERIEGVMAMYFDIDLQALSEEKSEMLREFRERTGV